MREMADRREPRGDRRQDRRQQDTRKQGDRQQDRRKEPPGRAPTGHPQGVSLHYTKTTRATARVRPYYTRSGLTGSSIVGGYLRHMIIWCSFDSGPDKAQREQYCAYNKKRCLGDKESQAECYAC